MMTTCTWLQRFLVRFLVLAILMAGPSASVFAAGTGTALPLSQERLQQGEKIYREGMLPSGEPVQALVKHDVPAPGTAFTCGSCHLRSGLGSIEGGVVTPPTNGRMLYSPLELKYKQVQMDTKYFPFSFKRPAYTDATLAGAILGGIDPSGRELNPVMPRYQMNDGDLAILIDYLKTLSAEVPPGAQGADVHFATIVTEEVPPQLREAFLYSLENLIRFKNNMAGFYSKNKRSARMVAAMVNQSKVEYQKLSLSTWVLKGAPESWPAQLADYYRKDPVFAVLGGISTKEWKPIHDFCEQHKLPTLFPITDLPVISNTDWYTLYLSKGVYQEGESAARYLNSLESIQSGSVLQIVRNSPKGIRLAKGFDETWSELGHARVTTVTLNSGEQLSQARLKQLIAKHKPQVLLVWDDADALAGINAMAAVAAGPQYVFVSSTYMGPRFKTLKDALRDRTYIMYPFSLPRDEAAKKISLEPLTGSKKFTGEAATVVLKVYSMANILTQALMDMRGSYYQDYFFDVIGMQADQPAPLYERLSFGPGQRYASKGCYVVQLTKGNNPEYLKKSEWVIY
jgi:ABC-type branched-subunit amino acid transport system substrate-binding protein